MPTNHSLQEKGDTGSPRQTMIKGYAQAMIDADSAYENRLSDVHKPQPIWVVNDLCCLNDVTCRWLTSLAQSAYF